MKFKIIFFLIIIFASFLRLFRLDSMPATLYGDEQAFAWNAYNILKLGQDEYGNPYPLQFRSFDDYKAPLPVYLLVPFIKIWGLTAFAIRLPIALVSTATIFVTYFLAKVFLNKRISLLVAYLFAISPWHLHLSRGFFEATLALLWFVVGIYFFLKSDKKPKFTFFSMLFFSLALYSYFTPRILIPVLLLFLFWYGHKYFAYNKKFIRTYILGIIFLFVLSLPLIKLTFLDKGFSRFGKLTETNNRIIAETVNRERYASNLPNFWKTVFHNKATIWLRLIKNNYLEHLSINYWYIYGDNSLRYFTGNMGMFYLIESIFLPIGLYALWRDKQKAVIFFASWILLAIIPASLVGRPFAVRSLALLPAPFIFVGYGFYKLSSCFSSKVKLKIVFSTVMTLSFIISIGIVLMRYYLEYPVYAATW